MKLWQFMAFTFVIAGLVMLGTWDYPGQTRCDDARNIVYAHKLCLRDDGCHTTQQDWVDYAQAVDLLEWCDD